MSFCAHCGSSLGEGAAFCPMCGTRAGAEPVSAPAQPSLPAKAGQDSLFPRLIGGAALATAAGLGVPFVLPAVSPNLVETPLAGMGISFAVSFLVAFLFAKLLRRKASNADAMEVL